VNDERKAQNFSKQKKIRDNSKARQKNGQVGFKGNSKKFYGYMRHTQSVKDNVIYI